MAHINEHDKNHILMINYLQGNQWLELIAIRGVCKYGNSTMTYSGAGLNPVIYCQEYEGNFRMKLATYLILMKNGLVSCPGIA
jgi:hypothetical protein